MKTCCPTRAFFFAFSSVSAICSKVFLEPGDCLFERVFLGMLGLWIVEVATDSKAVRRAFVIGSLVVRVALKVFVGLGLLLLWPLLKNFI